jgi:hypothetical protein
MTGVIITIVVLLVIIAVVAIVAMQMRRRRLQQQFGPEYQRAVEQGDSRLAAERDLAARQKRVRELDIRPLSPEARERYAARWQQVQADFVDAPNAAVGSAQDLVTEVMRDRGYPTDAPDQRMEDLSVEHADVMDNYRAAHGISSRARTGDVSTEDLRQAMVHYRTLFTSLLGHRDGTTPEERLDAQQPMTRDADAVDLRDAERTRRTEETR